MSRHDLISLQAVPVYQNKMFETLAEALACPTGDVFLVQHPGSGLVNNRAFDPAKLVYDGSYQNEQGLSPTFRAHINDVIGTLGRHFAGKKLLEIGCGKGAFLELLRDAGYEAIGVDPAYEGTSRHIIREHFRPGLGLYGDAIVMRHVLEHIPDPVAFLHHIRDANGGSGLVYIEVPCLDWILAHRAWFDVFYEHVNYFRLVDFKRIFGDVRESGRVFNGQYLYVVADLASLREPDDASLPAPTPATLPMGFFDSLSRCAGASQPGALRVVWGAAAKGVMFAHHMARLGLALDFAIDINPAKQGHFLAGSGLPVLGPAEGLARMRDNTDIFVMNSNYLPEIRAAAGTGARYHAVDQK